MLQGTGLCHADGGGNRRRSVSRDEGVVDSLVRLRKAGDAARLTKRMKVIPPPGDDLVGIALMPDVKNKPVPLRIVDPVDGDGKLHRAQVGRKVSACPRDAVDFKASKLVTEQRQIALIQFFDIRRRIDRF